VQTIVYKVCDNSNPQICNTGVQEITVLPTGADNSTVASDELKITIGSQVSSGNVLQNDSDPQGDQRTVTPQSVTTADGTFTINSAGDYTFTPVRGFSGPASFPYTACDNGTPQACATATVHVLVRLATTDAIDDDFSATPVNGFTGGTAGNVYTNDLVNNDPLQASKVTLTLIDNGGLTGVTIQATSGNLNVPAATKAGTYTVTYKICQVENPDVCDEGLVTVEVVPPVIQAVNDDLTDEIISNELGGKVGSIYENDKISGVSIDPSLRPNLELSIVSDGGLTGLTIDENGDITVPANFEPGTYTVTIKICEKLNPENCVESTATIKIEYTKLVAAGAVTPNNDGKNDFFHIRGLSAFPNNSLVVYNRWGNVVLKAAPYGNDWDGRSTNGLTFSGNNRVPAGTYFYVLETGDGQVISGSFYIAY
jgi:gliding motility-associated-like protein